MKLPGARRYKRILTLVIIILAALLVLAFVRFRMQTREARTSWVLEAATAKLYSGENRATLSDVQMRFFPEDRDEVRLTGAKGQFNTQTRNVSVSGSVVCRYSGYVLNTENLHYQHDSNIIYAESEIAVAGQNSQFTADSGEFEINTGTLRLNGNVEARINQIEKE